VADVPVGRTSDVEMTANVDCIVLLSLLTRLSRSVWLIHYYTFYIICTFCHSLKLFVQY